MKLLKRLRADRILSLADQQRHLEEQGDQLRQSKSAPCSMLATMLDRITEREFGHMMSSMLSF